MWFYLAKCDNSPTKETNSAQDSANWRRKANKFSTDKPTKKTVKSDSEEQPMKLTVTTVVLYKHAKGPMDQRGRSINT